MKDDNQEKAIIMLEEEVHPVLQMAKTYDITDPETMEEGINILGRVKDAYGKVEETRKFFTKPILDHKKAIDEKFRPVTSDLKEAERVLKEKMTDYRLSLPENKPKTESSSDAKATFVKVKKFRIKDEAALPRDYLCPDMKKIDRVVKAGIKDIPGVEIWEEESVRASAV